VESHREPQEAVNTLTYTTAFARTMPRQPMDESTSDAKSERSTGEDRSPK
jgi:hypothetical protein